MKLSSELIKRFVSATDDSRNTKTVDTIAYGTAVQNGDSIYVLIDGATTATPVSKAMDARVGDRVMVTIRNHTATITGNITTPANNMTEEVNTINSTIDNLDVNYASIQNGVINIAQIGDATITTAKIQDAAITNAKIANASIGTANIQDASIETAKIKDASITTAKIGDAQITNAKIANASIGTANIQDAAITNAKIGNLAVDSAKITDASITTAKIGDAQITSAKIADAAITTAKIGNAQITSAKIADASIGTATIQDAAITTAKIGNAEITGAKIGNATIDTANIKTGAITTALIGTGAIETAQIADGSITDAKIVTLSATKISAGTIDASNINVTNLKADNIVTGTITLASSNLAYNTTFNKTVTLPSGLTGTLANGVADLTQSTTSEKYFPLQRVNLIGGRDITLTYEYYADSYVSGGDIHVLASSLVTDDSNRFGTQYEFVHSSSTGTPIIDSWTKVTKTFTLTSAVKSGYVRIDHNGSKVSGTNANIKYRNIMLQYGKLSTQWQPHTNELLEQKGIDEGFLGDGAVTNRIITAETITGDKLVVDAITTREIAANAITANEIAANAITTDKLDANAITATKIAAGTITADKIAVQSYGVNLIKNADGSINSPTTYGLAFDNWSVNGMTSTSYMNKKDINFIDGGTISAFAFCDTDASAGKSLNILSDKIIIDPTKQYILEGWIRRSTVDGNAYIGIEQSDVNDVDLDSNGPYIASGVTPTVNQWAYYSGYIYPAKTRAKLSVAYNYLTDTTVTVDDITGFATSGLAYIGDRYFNYTGITGNQFTGVTNGNMNATQAIGTVIGTRTPVSQSTGTTGSDISFQSKYVSYIKIKVYAAYTSTPATEHYVYGLSLREVCGTSIEGGNIRTGSITANAIAANTITANEIAANAITVDELSANAVTASKIAAGAITADKLTIGVGEQGGYLTNPRFSKWASTYPDYTSIWNAGGIVKTTVDNVNVAQFNCTTPGTQYGMILGTSSFATGTNLDGMQYFCLEMRVRNVGATDTSFAGAAFLVDIGRQDNSSERLYLYPKDIVTAPVVNTWYTVRKVYKISDASIAKTYKTISGYLLANWVSAGDAVKTIQFAAINFYQATEQDYLSQSWVYPNQTTIDGGKIQTNTITANQINANAVIAGKIAADAVTTNTIAAGAVTADKLTVNVGGRNILRNSGSFGNTNHWALTMGTGQTGVFELATDTTYGTVIHYAKTNNVSWIVLANDLYTYFPQKFKVSKKYTISFKVRSLGGTNIIVAFKDQDASNVVLGETSIATTTSWTTVTKTFTPLIVGNQPQLYITSAVDEYWITDIKLEEGDIATEWSPSPEDVAGLIYNTQSTLDSLTDTVTKLSVDSDGILMSVDQLEVSVNSLQTTTENLSTQIAQTASDINFNITQQITSSTTDLSNSLNDFRSTVETNIKFDIDGISIGKSTSSFKTKITNASLDFTDDDTVVATISNKKMVITDAEVTSGFVIGNFQFVPRDNGNMSLVFRG